MKIYLREKDICKIIKDETDYDNNWFIVCEYVLPS